MEDRCFKLCRLSSRQAQYSGLAPAKADELKREERKRRGATDKREIAASV